MISIKNFGTDYNERINAAVANLKAGKGILLLDDEDRENEGDLIFCADNMSEKDMALMIKECSGIVCLCLTEQKAQQLALRPMVKNNTSKNRTSFTISIEAKEGVTTGVSAHDRITTIKAAISETAVPGDLAHPGHVFPLIAKAGGVFERRGHTEGSVYLMKIAGLSGSAVLCELMNEDGSMAKLPEITAFAQTHNLTVVTVEDIYRFRKNNSC